MNAELEDLLVKTENGVNLLLYFICSIWICIAYLGYTLVERSATRPHNSYFVLYRNTVNLCVAYFIFYLVGYGVSTEAEGGIVGYGKSYGQNFTSLDYSRWIISFGLCLISVQIQNSSLGERTHLGTHIIYSFYIAAIVYPIAASWVWGQGWLKQLEFVDFVGGGVVHMVSGFGGLVGTIFLGPRLEVISNLNRL
jgi:ammonium transporter, Amt family